MRALLIRGSPLVPSNNQEEEETFDAHEADEVVIKGKDSSLRADFAEGLAGTVSVGIFLAAFSSTRSSGLECHGYLIEDYIGEV